MPKVLAGLRTDRVASIGGLEETTNFTRDFANRAQHPLGRVGFVPMEQTDATEDHASRPQRCPKD